MHRILFLALLFCFVLPTLSQDNRAYQIALERIEEAERIMTNVLVLSGLGLTELPPEIGRLDNVYQLFLQNNQLTTLPPEIGDLDNLQRLILNNNQLTALPPELANLPNLNQLYLSNNQLRELPPEIGNVSPLYTLDLSFNQLGSLPPEIGKLKNLCQLDLSNNQIQYLPTEISHIVSFQHDGYCTMLLDDNPLVSPPQEVIAEGTAAISDYLENEAWWHLQRLIVGGASSFGLVAAVVLGIRWRQRGKQKKKR